MSGRCVQGWTDLSVQFRRFVLDRASSTVEVARAIPASRTSVYGWLKGRRVPCLAAQERIRDLISQDGKEK